MRRLKAKSGGWSAASAARSLSGALRRVMEDEFDLLTRILLEGGDDLPERRHLLGIEPALPPLPRGRRPGRRATPAVKPRRQEPGRATACVSLRQELLDAGDR